jgi:translation elongation factor EF-Tu-like GTPase
MPSVIVKLKMKTEADGGRHSPFNQGYCPHLVAESTSEWLGVRVIHCPEWVYPGTEAMVEFSLMYYPSLDYGALQAGTVVEVMEGPRAVGTGVVLELIR